DIHTHPSGDGNCEFRERRFQFQTAPANILQLFFNPDAAVRRNQAAGLVGALLIDFHFAGQDQGLCSLARFHKLPFDQRQIEPMFLLCHAFRYTMKSAICLSRSARSSKLRKATCAARRSSSAISRDRRIPYTAGKVIFCCALSLPAVFPKASDGCSTSRTSSMIWKARPTCSPYSDSAASSSSVA